jgi:hypothetical protein
MHDDYDPAFIGRFMGWSIRDNIGNREGPAFQSNIN